MSKLMEMVDALLDNYKQDRIKRGYTMLTLLDSSLRDMRVSKLAEMYDITPSEVIDLMCEAIEWEQEQLKKYKQPR